MKRRPNVNVNLAPTPQESQLYARMDAQKAEHSRAFGDETEWQNHHRELAGTVTVVSQTDTRFKVLKSEGGLSKYLLN